MNSIWSVRETEKSGEALFRKPSTVSEQVDFTKMMMSMTESSALEDFKALGDATSLTQASLILPTRENVEEISAYMEEKLNDAFKRAGIETDSAVTFTIGSDGSLDIKGERDDISEISELFENNTELTEEMRNFMAIASQMPAFERALEFQIKYQNADSKREIDALMEEYSDLLDGKDHYKTDFSFGDGKMDIETEFIA